MEELDMDELTQQVHCMFMKFVDKKQRKDDFKETMTEFLSTIGDLLTDNLKPEDLETIDTYLNALGIFEETSGDKENKE